MKLRKGTWLAAVSTGPDSMALLDMCLKSGVDCAVAHVNYHHQKLAEEEESYIRSFCAKHNLRLFVKNDPFVPTGNFEACARVWRYAFFAEIVKENRFAGVLVAHHEDDLIETFIMQQESGRTPDYFGLKEEVCINGIPVVRPLLNHTKQQLTEYCDAEGIRYYLDETNDSDVYTRNRIRHETVERMTLFERQMMRREIEMLNAQWQERRCRVRAELHGDRIRLDRYRMADEADRLTLLRMFLKQWIDDDISEKYLRNADARIKTEKDLNLKMDGFRLVFADGWIKKIEEPLPYSDTYSSMEELEKRGAYPYYRLAEGRAGLYGVTLKEADFPVTVRNWRSGDKIRMRFGMKSVHRFFIDRHIPRWQRALWPVVEVADGTVALVPGLGCDVKHYSIKPNLSVIQYLNSEGA